MSTLDYHIHTIVSTDADYTPAEIIRMAKKNGVKTLAITDHNNVASVAEAASLGEAEGIRVIPGIEIDCDFEGVGFHMTAYGIDITDPRYDELFHYYYDQSVENTWKAKHPFCEAMGLDLPDELLKGVAKDNILVPEDIGAYLLSHKEFDDLHWLDPYRAGGSRSDNPNVNFFWDFFSQGKPGYTAGSKKTAAEIIDLIHATGGEAVVAHPGANFKGKDEILERLLDSGVQGMEVYSSYHSEEQTRHYRQLALDHGLWMTCGSDFHGHHKPAIQIGRIPFLENEAEIHRF